MTNFMIHKRYFSQAMLRGAVIGSIFPIATLVMMNVARIIADIIPIDLFGIFAVVMFLLHAYVWGIPSFLYINFLNIRPKDFVHQGFLMPTPLGMLLVVLTYMAIGAVIGSLYGLTFKRK